MRRASMPAAAAALAVCVAFAQGVCHAQEPAKDPCNRIFYRVLDAATNAPVLPKSRGVMTEDWQTGTASTGMADEGFTEFPCVKGLMDLTFAENFAIYPRIISDAPADVSRVNTADMLIDHVYSPDGVVWGIPAKEFVQTFTATQDELVSVTLLVATEPGVFRVELLKGGPRGPRIGSIKTFWSGHSMETGYARWEPGEVPLIPGATYGLRFYREDGKAFSPYLHSTGNAYDGGLLYADTWPRPESDIAAWIVEQPRDLQRALVPAADSTGWVYGATSVQFRPRTANVRLMEAVVAPVPGFCDYLIVRVRDGGGKVVAGPKYGLGCGKDGGSRTAQFLFGSTEFPVRSGEDYTAEVFIAAHAEHAAPDIENLQARPLDIRLRVYGEPVPAVVPAISNLQAKINGDSEVEFSWSISIPAAVKIGIAGPGPNSGKVVEVPRGETSVRIPLLWSGHDYDFRLTSEGPTGIVWRTPVYRLRMPRNDVQPIVQPQYPADFITLATLPPATAPKHAPIRYLSQVEVANGDFEDGLKGWKVDGKDRVCGAPEEHGVLARNGKGMAGWSILAGEQREQVLRESRMFQKVRTTPGHRYLLSVWGLTEALGGPRGDTRVRLFADPAGGSAFEGRNASQWYWTDGKWMRFQHEFVAESGSATIGCGFFRWRDIARASAYVDRVHLYDLGPAGPSHDTPAPASRGFSAFLPQDNLPIVEDRVEAFAAAPPGYVITGIGARGHEDNVTTIWLKVQPVLADGTLGPAEQIRAGWEPDGGLEAQIEMPAGYVLTGFGARAAPEWDVKSLTAWGRPLLPDGSLGEEKMFTGGIEPDRGPESELKAPEGRVVVSAGMNMSFNDINAVRADSAALVRRTAAGLQLD